MKLRSFTLQIYNPEETLNFYKNVLGFSLVNEFTEGSITYYDLGFNNPEYYIRLKYNSETQNTLYQEKSIHNYWKYSLFVDNIQEAYQNIVDHNCKIGEPFQFGEIGYLSHTVDTENHKIEYIQKTFKQNKEIATKERTALGLLTIRTKDPIKIIKLYEEVLDMKLFVRMYVQREKGFTLYFLGDKNLQAPNPDIDAIENREWMYQQSHLFIEIQHFWNSEYDDFKLESTNQTGLQTINFSGNLDNLQERLSSNNIAFQKKNNKIVFNTIDNYIIEVEADK